MKRAPRLARLTRPTAAAPGPVSSQVRAIIASLDVDQNGKIEWAEFSALMADRWLGKEVRASESAARVRPRGNPARASSVSDRLCSRAGSQGRIDIEVAGATLAGLAEERLTPSPSDGSIPVSFLKGILGGVGEAPMSDAELSAFLAMVDPSGTGSVSMEHFLKLPCWDAPDLPTLIRMSNAGLAGQSHVQS